MDTSDPTQNPYASPSTSCDATPPDWYLASACRYLKLMAWASIVYILCMLTLCLYMIVSDESPLIGEMVGPPLMATAVVLFSALMIRTATVLPNDFERLHKRARWLGILAAAFGCPILTIPAFVAVSRLSKYRKMISDDLAVSENQK